MKKVFHIQGLMLMSLAGLRSLTKYAFIQRYPTYMLPGLLLPDHTITTINPLTAGTSYE